MALALRILAGVRLVVGTSAFLAPGLTATTAFFPAPLESLYAVRLFGVREAVLGAFVWSAETPEDCRRVLLAGAVIDGLDVVAALWAFFAGGDLEAMSAISLGGGATCGLAMAAIAWSGLGLGKSTAKTA